MVSRSSAGCDIDESDLAFMAKVYPKTLQNVGLANVKPPAQYKERHVAYGQTHGGLLKPRANLRAICGGSFYVC